MDGMSNARIFDQIWIDDAIDTPMPLFSWGPDGFGHPTPGFWRGKTGDQVNIETMVDSYLLNCIKFLREKSFCAWHTDVESWPIYKRLMQEAINRGIDDRTEWDN
jgi:hypothetical protein